MAHVREGEVQGALLFRKKIATTRDEIVKTM
jgi:hypothetical protein